MTKLNFLRDKKIKLNQINKINDQISHLTFKNK